MTSNTDTPDEPKPMTPADRLASMPSDPMEVDVGLKIGARTLTILQDRWNKAVEIAGGTIPDALIKLQTRYSAAYGRLLVFLDKLVTNQADSRATWSTRNSLDTQKRHLAKLEQDVINTKQKIEVLERDLTELAKGESRKHDVQIGVLDREVLTARGFLEDAIDKIIDDKEEEANRV